MAPDETLWHLAFGGALVPVDLRTQLTWDKLGPPVVGLVGALALSAVPGIALLEALDAPTGGPPLVPDIELAVVALSSARLILLGTHWWHVPGRGWQVRVVSNTTWTADQLPTAPVSLEKHGWFGNWRLRVGEGRTAICTMLGGFHFAPANKEQVAAIAQRMARARGPRT